MLDQSSPLKEPQGRSEFAGIKTPVIAIVGSTATGKSDLSLAIAQVLGGSENVEIINADSMQLYRGMDIGTAKLSLVARQGIEHHYLDVLEVEDEASVAVYQRKARKTLEELQAAGKTVLVVGGSGLYIRALIDNLEFPPTDPRLREELTVQADLDPAGLRARLWQLDPQAAAQIENNNLRRWVRAIEVVLLTGQPFAAQQPEIKARYDCRQYLLEVPTDFLQERIAKRTEKMFSDGLVAETQEILNAGHRFGKTAAGATGYAQALAVIAGQMTENEAIEATNIATRQLAKKQRTWFRRDKRIKTLPIFDSAGKLQDFSTLAAQICADIDIKI